MPENILASTPILILAGGLGTRLRSALPDRPKGLAPIAGKPFLEIQIQLLRNLGALNFVLCVGYQAQQIVEYLGDGSQLGVHIEYSFETQGLLGTGGAIKLAEQFIHPRALVLNGDTFFDIDYVELLQTHLQSSAIGNVAATLAVSQVTDRSRFGSIYLDPSHRWITSFKEKESLTETRDAWVNGGVYVVESELMRLIPAGAVVSIERDTFPAALRQGFRLGAYHSNREFYDIGTPESWQAFIRFFETTEHNRIQGQPGDRSDSSLPLR